MPKPRQEGWEEGGRGVGGDERTCGGTIDRMTAEEIEMDRTEWKRTWELSKLARQRQEAGDAEVAKRRRGKTSRLDGQCVMCHVWPGSRCVSRVARLQGHVTWVCSRW